MPERLAGAATIRASPGFTGSRWACGPVPRPLSAGGAGDAARSSDVGDLQHVDCPGCTSTPLDYATRAHEILEDAQRDLMSGTDVPLERRRRARDRRRAGRDPRGDRHADAAAAGPRQHARLRCRAGCCGCSRRSTRVRDAHHGSWPALNQLTPSPARPGQRHARRDARSPCRRCPARSRRPAFPRSQSSIRAGARADEPSRPPPLPEGLADDARRGRHRRRRRRGRRPGGRRHAQRRRPPTQQAEQVNARSLATRIPFDGDPPVRDPHPRRRIRPRSSRSTASPRTARSCSRRCRRSRPRPAS